MIDAEALSDLRAAAARTWFGAAVIHVRSGAAGRVRAEVRVWAAPGQTVAEHADLWLDGARRRLADVSPAPVVHLVDAASGRTVAGYVPMRSAPIR